MESLLAAVVTILHVGLCLLGAPLLWGIINVLCARMRGQRGPSLRQPYRHLIRLLGKMSLMPNTATDMFTLWPLVAFMAWAVAVMLIPGFCTGMLTASASDYVTIIGLFALGRAATMLGGLEAGTAFGGMGVTRMALRSLGVEATLLVLLWVFAGLTGQTNLDEIALAFGGRHVGSLVVMGFALAAMLMIAVIATNDQPAAGQELAMMQSAVKLEYSGRQLALLDYADMLRLLAWMNLIICIFIPFGMAQAQIVLSWPGGLVLWIAKLLGLGVGLAVFSSVRIQARLFRVPESLGIALGLSLLASIVLVVMIRAGA